MKTDEFLEKFDKKILTEEEKKDIFLLIFEDKKNIKIFSKIRRVWKRVKIKDRYFFLGNGAKGEASFFFRDPLNYGEIYDIEIREIVDKEEIKYTEKMLIIG